MVLSSADGRDLPSRHHLVAGIVSLAHIVEVRQLHLVVVEVEVLRIHVGYRQIHRRAGHSRSRDSHVQRLYLFLCGWCLGGIVVDNRRVLALRLQYRIWCNVGVEHPLGHLGPRPVGIACHVAHSQLAVAVEQQAVDLETSEEALLGSQRTVGLVDAADGHIVLKEVVVVV